MDWSPVNFNGYRATAEGISIWPRRRLKHRWDQLRSIQTQHLPLQKQFNTRLEFATGRTLILRATRLFSFGHSLGRYAEVLQLAVGSAPPEASVDDLTRDVVRWGPRSVRHELAHVPVRFRSADDCLGQARNHRVWLEPRKALKAVEAALQQRTDHREALKLRVQLLAESGARPPRLLAASAQWLGLYPRDLEALETHLVLRLAGNDASAVSEATAWLASKPDHPGVAAALAVYHFKRKDYVLAEAVWGRLARTTKDEAVREAASANRTYAGHYGKSRGFRTSERLKNAGRIALVWAPMTIFLVANGYVRYSEWRSKRQIREMRDHVEREIIPAMEQRHAAYTEQTGMIIGSLAEVEARAAAGEPPAEYTLAQWLLTGRYGVAADPARGLHFLERAAAQDHRAAVLSLAERLERGDGIAHDATRALALYEKAAALGSPRAARIAGQHHRKGEVVPQDLERAYSYFVQAADGGHTYAMSLAGWALERGEGVEPDLPRALAYYRRAAERKDRWAQERLVALLSQPHAAHADPEEAWQWMVLGANEGSPTLRVRFARTLLSIREGNPDEKRQAFEWMCELADTDTREAAYLLGRMYWTGWYTTQDLSAAAGCFAREAARNHPPSVELLLRCHAFGVGVDRDQARAAVLRDQFASNNPPAVRLDRVDAMLAATRQPLTYDPMAAEAPRQIVWQQRPEYPPVLRRQGVTGSAVVEFMLDETGFARDVRVIEASHPEFGAAAVAAVSFWRIAPELKEGVPHLGPRRVPITFSITPQAETP